MVRVVVGRGVLHILDERGDGVLRGPLAKRELPEVAWGQGVRARAICAKLWCESS